MKVTLFVAGLFMAYFIVAWCKIDEIVFVGYQALLLASKKIVFLIS